MHFSRCCHVAVQKLCKNTHPRQPAPLLDTSQRSFCPGPCASQDPHVTRTPNSWSVTDTWGSSVAQQWHSRTHDPHSPLFWHHLSPRETLLPVSCSLSLKQRPPDSKGVWTMPLQHQEGLCPFSLLLCLITYNSASSVVHYRIWMVVLWPLLCNFFNIFTWHLVTKC